MILYFTSEYIYSRELHRGVHDVVIIPVLHRHELGDEVNSKSVASTSTTLKIECSSECNALRIDVDVGFSRMRFEIQDWEVSNVNSRDMTHRGRKEFARLIQNELNMFNLHIYHNNAVQTIMQIFGFK